MKNANQTTSNASMQKANQQNAQYGTEFARDTDVASVKKANAQSAAKSQQASSQSATE